VPSIRPSRPLALLPFVHVDGGTGETCAFIEAGNLGPPGSLRRARAESRPVAFRPTAAQPFDDRCLSWRFDAKSFWIWWIEPASQA
jgi:hypothetical protein